MGRLDEIEAEARRVDAAFKMRHARVRYRAEVKAKTARDSFRSWVRRTYNVTACAGKLAQIVRAS